MRLLLDTHVFLWYVKADQKLSSDLYSLIQNAIEVYVSSATIWEIAIKKQLGKIQVEMDELVKSINGSDFIELPITIEHAAAVANLPFVHKDPFDRLLIAQAITEPLTFLTIDEKLQEYSCLSNLKV